MALVLTGGYWVWVAAGTELPLTHPTAHQRWQNRCSRFYTYAKKFFQVLPSVIDLITKKKPFLPVLKITPKSCDFFWREQCRNQRTGEQRVEVPIWGNQRKFLLPRAAHQTFCRVTPAILEALHPQQGIIWILIQRHQSFLLMAKDGLYQSGPRNFAAKE